MTTQDKLDELYKLLAASKECVEQGLLASLADQQIITKEIQCISLDYTIDEPFPPVFGFGQPTELLRYLDDGEHPLSSYNSPDFEYFSEDNSPAIEFSKRAQEVFESTNDCLLNNFSYDEYKLFIFDAYVDICKALNRNKELRSLLPVHKDFHVIANDFDEINGWEIMQQALPKVILNKIKKAVNAYERKPVLSVDEQALHAEIATTLATKGADYERLAKNLSSRKHLRCCYAPELLFYLEPFRYEIEHNEANIYPSLEKHPKVTAQPASNDYYRYFLEGERVYAINYYQEGVLKTETYFVYNNSCVEAYTFIAGDNPALLGEYCMLTLNDAVPRSYKTIRDNRISKIVYALTSTGMLAEATSNESDFFEADIYDRPTLLNHDRKDHYRYIYSDSGGLVRILECYGGNRRVGDIAYSDNEATVVYSVDFGFIDEAMITTVQVAHDHILPILAKKNIGLIKAFVLEHYERTPFPLWHVYSITERNKQVRWHKFKVYDDTPEHEMVYLKFNGYILTGYSNSVENLTEAQAQAYRINAYELLAQKLSTSLSNELHIAIPVYTKTEHEDKTRINSLVIKE